MFFERSEELKQARLVPLILDAVARLGGTPTRPEIIEEAIRLGQFSEEELAVSSHRRQDREMGRRAVAGTLRYAIWEARTRGDLLDGDTGGVQTLTDQGMSRVGAATGYPALDARRLLPGTVAPEAPRVQLRPFVPSPASALENRSLSEALPRSGAFDLDLLERRTHEHHQLVARAASWLESHGWSTGLAPQGTVPADLMAEIDGHWLVIEGKTLDSTRPALARHQLRLGLGQVIEYRERLRSIYADTEAMLVISHRPVDLGWEGIARSAGVPLVIEPFGRPPSLSAQDEGSVEPGAMPA